MKIYDVHQKKDPVYAMLDKYTYDTIISYQPNKNVTTMPIIDFPNMTIANTMNVSANPLVSKDAFSPLLDSTTTPPNSSQSSVWNTYGLTNKPEFITKNGKSKNGSLNNVIYLAQSQTGNNPNNGSSSYFDLKTVGEEIKSSITLNGSCGVNIVKGDTCPTNTKVTWKNHNGVTETILYTTFISSFTTF